MSFKYDNATDKLFCNIGNAQSMYNAAFWINLAANPGLNSASVFQHEGRPFCYFVNQTSLRWGSLYTGSDPIWSGAGATPLDTWVHWAITHDARQNANKPKFYRNGVEVAVTTPVAPSGSREVAARLWVGGDNTTSHTLQGKLSDFAIWQGRILSAAEILSVYLRGPGSVPRNRFLHWSGKYLTTMTAGVRAPDESGNGRHGTVQGSLTVEADSGWRGLNVGPQMVS